MHSDFLANLFGDKSDKIGILSKETQDVVDYASPEEAAEHMREGDSIELITVDDYAVAVCDPDVDPDKATFHLENGEDSIAVFVFEEPIKVADIKNPDELLFYIPVPLGSWSVRTGTNTLFTYDEVFTDAPTIRAPDPVNAFLTAGSSQDSVEEHDDVDEVPLGPTAEQERLLAEDANFLNQVTAKGITHVPSIRDEDYWLDTECINYPESGSSEYEALEEFLSRPATFMAGQVYESYNKGKGDRRNTQPGQWQRVEMPWRHWLVGMDATKQGPEWGFLRHPVASEKGGDSVIFAETLEGQRLKTAVKTFYAMGIDIDSGDDLFETIERVKELGYLCFVYTSYNHGKTSMRLKQQAVMQKLRIDHTPTVEDVRRYLKDHHKGGLSADFIAQVTIDHQGRDPTEGIVIDLTTPPLQKFRLVFPLEAPVEMLDLSNTIEGACEIWENKVTGLATQVLKVNFDTACTDVTRVFYTPRHPEGAGDNWYSAIIAGGPLRFDAIPSFKKSTYLKMRESGDNAFIAANDANSGKTRQEYVSPKGKSLNSWHKKCKDRFLLADVLEAYCSEKIRQTGAEGVGQVHVECPFEHLHTNHGGTACMAINALDSTSDYWTWFCHHDSCQGRDKLAFLEKALADEWFPEEALSDPEFVLAAADNEQDDDDADADDKPALEATDVPKSFEDQARELPLDSTETDIRQFIVRLRKNTTDKTVWNSVKEILVKRVKLTATDLNNIWKELVREDAKKARAKKSSEPDSAGIKMIRDEHEDDLVEYAIRSLESANFNDPYLFRHMRELVRINEDDHGILYLQALDRDKLGFEISRVTQFGEYVGDEKRRVLPPPSIVRNIYASPLTQFPVVNGIISTPIFAKDGKVLTKEGYDSSSGLYYAPDLSLSIPRVESKPSEEDVFRAKQLLIEDVLGDFPLGGKTRDEIIEQGLYGEGVSSVTNMVGLLLLPFVREMIDGPTPGHLLTKPVPGSGASLLTEIMHLVCLGHMGAASTFPSGRNNESEVQKTLFAMFASGKPVIWFDNINESIDSGDLAAAMTASVYEARVLGRSEVVPVNVRCTWVFTGNNVLLSNEMARRMCMIDLDPRMANPERRSGWHHDNLIGWVREHRGELVWACLTLVQHWIASGRPGTTTPALATYENWTKVIGGILENAGLGKFMENRSELREIATDGKEDEYSSFVTMWWNRHGPDPITVADTGVTDEDRGLARLTMDYGIDLTDVKRSGVGDGVKYDNVSFGKMLKGLNKRVFEVWDEEEEIIQRVAITSCQKRGSKGSRWQLERLVPMKAAEAA